MSEQPTSRCPADIELELRRMNFGFAPSIPTHWARDSKFITHWFNALSSTLPPTEKYLIDAVRAFDDRVTDPKLREAIRTFVAQEGHHGFQHRALNGVLEKSGIDMTAQERWIRRLLQKIWDNSRPEQRLALSASLEHFTAVYSDQLLRDPENMRGFEDRMRALWRWHAMEETEHKSVLFDAYQYVSGRYFQRIDLHFWVTLILVPVLHFLRLMWSDRRRGSLKDVIKGFWYLYVRPGSLRRLIPGYLQCFRRSFHPWQHDNRELLRAWKRSDEAKHRMLVS
jgi:predicted metal-dependent hydrolase